MSEFEEIETILNLIEDGWRNYIFEYPYFKNLSALNFSVEVEHDMPGVIFGYFQDTLPIIYNYRDAVESNDLNSIFLKSIGLLQILYLHQDLLTELKKVFGLSHNNQNETIRQLRNELIGHPISRCRETKELSSMSLFGYRTSLEKIVYLKYSQENNFGLEINDYSTEKLILEHTTSLVHGFKLIQKKTNTFLSQFRNMLSDFNEKLYNLEFQDLLNFLDKNYDSIYLENRAFSRENIILCRENIDCHERYKYTFKLFMTELCNSIKGDINNINSNYLKNRRKPIKIDSKDLKSNYTLGKLHSQNDSHKIDYLIETLKTNGKIVDELMNMKNNIDNSFEYSASFNYLKYLLNKEAPEFLE